MLSFDEPVREIQILDEAGKPLPGKDHDRRFFEASWMHKYNEKYNDVLHLIYIVLSKKISVLLLEEISPSLLQMTWLFIGQTRIQTGI